MTVVPTVSRSARLFMLDPYPVKHCSEYLLQPGYSDFWRPCGRRGIWKVTGTTPDGDVGGRPYHWTRFMCGRDYEHRFPELAANTRFESVTATSVPVPGFRWATLLMIRDWTDALAPECVADRLTASEASAASRGLFGERYAAEALRGWMDETPCVERAFVQAAWVAVHAVIDAEHHIPLVQAQK